MPHALRTLINLCLFKAKPQDLPATRNLLINTIAATLVLSIIRNYYLTGGSQTLFFSALQVVLLGVSLKILLMLFNKNERWLQSATALYGSSALILVVILPIILSVPVEEIASEELTLHKILMIIAGLWYFIVIVTILKETLEISVFLAIIITVVLELTFATIFISLFSEALP